MIVASLVPSVCDTGKLSTQRDGRYASIPRHAIDVLQRALRAGLRLPRDGLPQVHARHPHLAMRRGQI